VLAIGIPIASVLGATVGLAGVSAAFTLAPGLAAPPPTELLLLAALVAVVSCAYEVVTHRHFARRQRVLLVCGHDYGAELAIELARHPELPYEIVGVVVDADVTAGGYARIGGYDDLPALIERERPELIVLADVSDHARVVQRLFDAATVPFRVVDVRHFYEHAFGRVPVENLTPSWFMSILHLYRRPYSRLTKRAFDLALASVGILVAAPLMAVAAVLVRCSGRGPVLFRQIRIGEGGEPFEIFKFRTMIVQAEQDGVAIWASPSDPRITPAGRFLRRTRMDELPQLFNVVRGDMSIVGPRPERPEFLELLSEEVPFWRRRHLVKPGITGWAQIRCGYTSDAPGAAEKLSYDLYYLKHRSLLLDLAITARTAAVVVTGSGAH
jgi:exopolysaccharide biosynthesis polyprenyl glycosylphosphotransferase